MPKVDFTLEKNKLFNPKKHTPWDSLEKYANELVLKSKTQTNENGIQNGIQEMRNGIQNGIQENTNKKFVKKLNLASDIVHSLQGTKKKVLIFLASLCMEREDLTTLPVNCKELSKIINEKYTNIKQAISRLKKDCLIESVKSKDGRGGFACFKITESTKIYILEYKKKYLLPEYDCDETVYKTVYNDNVVSSSYINTTNYLPEEFQQIDFSPLIDIGFDESHIIQICREHKKNPELALSAEIIQNSINAFAFDLKHNDVVGTFKAAPAVVLTSLLKKGQPYSSKTPDKVLSPREEAMQEYLLAQQKKNLKILEFETQTKDSAQQEWLNSLS